MVFGYMLIISALINEFKLTNIFIQITHSLHTTNAEMILHDLLPINSNNTFYAYLSNNIWSLIHFGDYNYKMNK